MSKLVEGIGHAKLILSGEHAVVYGHPAIAMAVDRKVTVNLCTQAGPTSLLAADIQDERLLSALQTALPSTGYGVRIQSDFPAGRGMGSSAALAVALARARAAAEKKPETLSTTCERAMAVEQIFHGNPSGLDHTVSARGGLVWYRKGPPLILQQLPRPNWKIVVIDSGASGNTAHMVRSVAALGPKATPFLNEIGQLVEDVRNALHDISILGPLLNENHRLLGEIGVTNESLDNIASWARRNGAYGAKMAGAGGGGIVIAITNDSKQLLHKAKEAGLQAFNTSIVEPTWE